MTADLLYLLKLKPPGREDFVTLGMLKVRPIKIDEKPPTIRGAGTFDGAYAKGWLLDAVEGASPIVEIELHDADGLIGRGEFLIEALSLWKARTCQHCGHTDPVSPHDFEIALRPVGCLPQFTRGALMGMTGRPIS